MWKKALLLIISVVLIPALAVYLEPPLTDQMHTIFMALLKVYIVATLLCFMVSTIAKNYSQVDKLWSVMPIIYAWIVCVMLDFEPRVLLMAILASIWGIRLTLNFARRGGYSWRFWEGEEDYRWAEVRKRPGFSHPAVWSVFNFAFISFYQMGLILLFTLPILKSGNGTEISLLDLVLATVFILLVYLQAIADTQQWNFQTQKYKLLEQDKSLPEEYAHGFVKTGLWSFARHPNYACEQAIWITYYLFSIVATGQWLNWSITGCILLVILFRNSSDLSEEISALKYSKYQNYQNDVPRFLPLKLPK